MSKKLTHKGIAFGAMVALGASFLASAPAQAEVTNPITLTSNGGASGTFTSLIGSGLTLTPSLVKSNQNVAYALIHTDINGVTQAEWATADAYNIGNAGAILIGKTELYNASQRVGTPVATFPSEWTYSALTTAQVNLTSTTDTTEYATAFPAVDSYNSAYYLIENPGSSELVFEFATPVEGDGSFVLYDLTAGADLGNNLAATTVATVGTGNATSLTAGVYTTVAKKIAVKANSVSGTPGARALSPLKIDAKGTAAVEIKVTAWTDSSTASDTANAGPGFIDSGELRSDSMTVKLLPVNSVSFITTMDSTNTLRGASTLSATVSVSVGVNNQAISDAGKFYVVFYKDGVKIDGIIANDSVITTADVASVGSLDVVKAYNNTSVLTFTATNPGVGAAGNLGSAFYAARALYESSPNDVFLGSSSALLDLRDGTNAEATGIKSSVVDSATLIANGNTTTAKTGTKTVPVALQIQKSGPLDLAASGVRVRVTVKGTKVAADSAITVEGATGSITKVNDTITYLATTNSSGKVMVNVLSSKGTKEDSVTIDYSVQLLTGVYTPGIQRTLVWADAKYSALKASPSDSLSGETVNVTFTATDQFGVGIDNTSAGRVSIQVVAVIDGIVKSSVYSETVTTTNGSASFSFKNFATVGSNQEIIVYVYQGGAGAISYYYSVYAETATNSIAVTDSFSNTVVYKDFVSGNAKVPADLSAITKTGLPALIASGGEGSRYATIVGTVLDASNKGQPGKRVTVATPGALFYDLETTTYAKDTINLTTNSQGYFDVQVLSHIANAAGATVTITSGDKSATTLLKTILPNNISAGNLKFSWTLPTSVVQDKTYTTVASLKDMWGNPIHTTGDEVIFNADGAVQVNGIESLDVKRDFNAKGESTVFLRSDKGIAGPGSFTATLQGPVTYYTGAVSGATSTFATTVSANDPNTLWDETTFIAALTTDIEVLEGLPAGSYTVNAGSFNSFVAVYAKGLKGETLSWKIAGKWMKFKVTQDYQVFKRKTGNVGATINIDLFVNSKKSLSKKVVTR
jgi:hypothetical protein